MYMEKKDIKDWNEELELCKKSPYYFVTKYLKVNGQDFTTRYTEEEFNKLFEVITKNKIDE